MRSILIAIALLSVPTLGHAVNMQFCFRHSGNYRDSGLAGEDYWTDTWGSTANPKHARGANVGVLSGQPLAWRWGGFLGDGLGTGDPGLGCTAQFPVPNAGGPYVFYVATFGHVNGWTIYVKHRFTRQILNNAFAYNHTGGAGKVDVTLQLPANGGAEDDAWDIYNTYQAVAYALYRHGGGMPEAQDLNVMVGDTPSPNETECGGGPCSCSACYGGTPGTVFIANSYQDRKFQVVHEVGHALYERYMGDHDRSANNQGFSDPSDPDPDNPNPNSHFPDDLCPTDTEITGLAWDTLEYAGGPQFEGWASFYAADVFNNHAEQDCSFRSYETVNWGNSGGVLANINCEDDSPDPAPGNLFPRGFMENACGADVPSSMNGLGVMIDWVRTYWNVHTDGGAAAPSFWSMLDWVDSTGDPWTSQKVYNRMDEAAQVFPDLQLRSNWNAAKDFTTKNTGHGINHPWPE